MSPARAAAEIARGEPRVARPPSGSPPLRLPYPPVTVAVANSKGGVGKSSIAYLYSLFLSITRPDVQVEVVDLDPQGTTIQSLSRFRGTNLTAYDWEHFFLFASKMNDPRVRNHIARRGNKCQVIDTPAGVMPSTHRFLYHCDIILVPLSASDADIFATKTFLERLVEHHDPSDRGRPLPEVLIIPNQVENKDQLSEIAFALRRMPVYMGRSLKRSDLFHKAFRREAGNESLINLLKENREFLAWLRGFVGAIHQREFRPGMLRPA
jgi:cellulose biosynthesis protein BcsQ